MAKCEVIDLILSDSDSDGDFISEESHQFVSVHQVSIT